MKLRVWLIFGALVATAGGAAADWIARTAAANRAMAGCQGPVKIGLEGVADQGQADCQSVQVSRLPWISGHGSSKASANNAETQSLMMMVTPRIVIQEEEEDELGIAPPP